MSSVATVILAAGMGTRMRSRQVKVLHPLVGRPMISHVIEAVTQAGSSRVIVVVGHQADRVRAAVNVNGNIEFVVQEEQLGTAHAVSQAASALADHDGDVLVTYGDTPLYLPQTYETLIASHRKAGAKATLLSTIVEEPFGYGRVVRDPTSDGFVRIVEQKDIDDPHIETINEINTGTYCFERKALFDALKDVKNDNQQGEYYLPDVFTILRDAKEPIGIEVLADSEEAMGINDRKQLAAADQVLRRRVLDRLMAQGVSIVDPDQTYIHDTVRIGADTTVYPYTVIEGSTVIGEECIIGPHAHLSDAEIGNRAKVEQAVVHRSRVADDEYVLPFTRLVPEGDEQD